MKIVIVSVLFVGLILFVSGTAYAELNTTHLSSDEELVALLTDTMFVSEGRIGDRGGAANFELCLGHTSSAPAQTAQYDWQSGTAEPFVVTYDSGTNLVTFTLGGITLNYTTPYFDFEVIFVRARAVNDATSMVVTDLVLDGENVGDLSSAAGPDGLDILLIAGGLLNDGFTLEGTAVLTWTGTPPTQSRLAFQVKVAKLVQIGVEQQSWGAIKSL